MIVRVQDIPQEGLEIDFELELEKLSERVNGPQTDTLDSKVNQPQYAFEGKIPVHTKLYSDGRTVDIKGDIKAKINTLCSRCISKATYDLDVPFDLIVKPRQNEKDEEDVGYALYEGDDLDCNAVVEDLLVLNIPPYIVCAEDCKGLCPQCGGNLNETICNCDKSTQESGEPKNNPFAKLKDLKIN